MENKLPADFKAKWVAALRSGEYKQGVSYLWNEEKDSFCCLGVAGVLCGIPKNVMKYRPWFHHLPLGIPIESVPPLLRPGLSTSNGIPEKLAEMNDGRMGERWHSFSEIADYIEANL